MVAWGQQARYSRRLKGQIFNDYTRYNNYNGPAQTTPNKLRMYIIIILSIILCTLCICQHLVVNVCMAHDLICWLIHSHLITLFVNSLYNKYQLFYKYLIHCLTIMNEKFKTNCNCFYYFQLGKTHTDNLMEE